MLRNPTVSFIHSLYVQKMKVHILRN